MSGLFWLFGIICIWLFHEGIYLPVIVSVVAIGAVAWHLSRLYKRSRVGPLTMLLFIVYLLPFIHIVPYVWFDFEVERPLILWGMAVRPDMLDRTIIELMSMLGAVGAVGLASGISLLQRRIPWASAAEAAIRTQKLGQTLSMPIFWTWITFAILFSWISAPSDTLLSSAYTHSQSMHSSWNFSSAWMCSYAFLVFALADSLFEKRLSTANLKRKIVLFAILFIAIWFQLLRGDRAILPCVVAALLMYYVWGERLLRSARSRSKWGWPTLLLSAYVILVSASVVGAVRHSLVGMNGISELLNLLNTMKDAGIFRFDNFITGTWSAALLTPMSVAGDYINGTLPLKYGQTYLDLIASIIPGFVADWIGYVRPIDRTHGPAWEMTYGIGGTHAVVVPFMNFRITGVFVTAILLAYGLARIERYSITHFSTTSFALLGLIAAGLPHALWYGEKYLMNVLIIWAILAFIYRLQLVKGRTHRTVSHSDLGHSS